VAWGRLPVLSQRFPARHRRLAGTPAVRGELSLALRDGLGHLAAPLRARTDLGRNGVNHEGLANAKPIRARRRLAALPSPVAGAAVGLASNPGHLAQLGLPRPCPQQEPWPVTVLVAQARVCGIGDDIDQAIEQGRVIEHGLGGVAAFEDDATSLPDGVDGSGEVAQQVAGPGGQLTLGVSDEQVEVVGHDAKTEEVDTGVGLLGTCEPLEDGLVDGGFGA